VNGKRIRRSLHNEGGAEKSFLTAKLRLDDFIKRQRRKKMAGTFETAGLPYAAGLESDR
jgi:hypothetical protein